MSVSKTVQQQYIRIVDRAMEQAYDLKIPREGWLTTMRKALRMPAPQLARRAEVTKAAIYQAERKEREGGITVRQMRKLANALGGQLVYAIVLDDGDVNTCLRNQARTKAEKIVRRTSSHMALEKQSLSDRQITWEIEQMTDQLVREMPPDFWDEP
ncbi:MAG: transcriptional regulator [Gammaproteobacteria bacterium]|nr:transcriptional regulator [Gammaproteobacteria bacterium]